MLTAGAAVCGPPLLGSARRYRPAELRALVPRIGGTPVAAVHLLMPEPRRVLLKLEGHNPGGSLKDRTALMILRTLEGDGRLRPGATLVDSTSGNFGISMSWLSRAHGYRFIAITDPNVTAENLERMRALGARVEVVRERDDAGGYLRTRMERAREVAASIPGAVWTDQYGSPANPAAHERLTGPEILGQVPDLDAVFVPASTGGTLAGIGACMRSSSPATRVVAVDGEGSVLFGGCAGPRRVNGLGSSHRSPFITPGCCDEAIRVAADRAFAYCRGLRAATGIEIGGSSGAALAACATYLKANPDARALLCVSPDNGANYRSTIFNDDWIRERGIALPSQPLVRAG